MVGGGSQENRVHCQNVRAILWEYSLSFPPSNTIIHYDKIKSDMVYYIHQHTVLYCMYRVYVKITSNLLMSIALISNNFG